VYTVYAVCSMQVTNKHSYSCFAVCSLQYVGGSISYNFSVDGMTWIQASKCGSTWVLVPA
jgi:hypothetical protein